MTRNGRLFEDIIEEAAFAVIENLPRAKRRDADFVENAVERAVRAAVNEQWGKKPICHVQIVMV